MGMNVILLGPPGAGKGTQASSICKHYSIPHISTGDILRDAASHGTKLGLEATKYMNAGQLVPDNLVIKLVKERLAREDCRKGFILDGFPRTTKQAEGLDSITLIDVVVLIAVPDEVLLTRLTGRRTCACGAVYHVTSNPPRKEGICDRCGGKLFQREDDTDAVIKNRLNTYSQQTQPLIEFYDEKGILKRVNGTLSIDETQKQIVKLLECYWKNCGYS
jgi:adenylate kinase